MAHWNADEIERFDAELRQLGISLVQAKPSGSLFRPTMAIDWMGPIELKPAFDRVVKKYDDKAEARTHERS